jgi:hypothetical protein
MLVASFRMSASVGCGDEGQLPCRAIDKGKGGLQEQTARAYR